MILFNVNNSNGPQRNERLQLKHFFHSIITTQHAFRKKIQYYSFKTPTLKHNKRDGLKNFGKKLVKLTNVPLISRRLQERPKILNVFVQLYYIHGHDRNVSYSHPMTKKKVNSYMASTGATCHTARKYTRRSTQSVQHKTYLPQYQFQLAISISIGQINGP